MKKVAMKKLIKKDVCSFQTVLDGADVTSAKRLRGYARDALSNIAEDSHL